MINQEEKELQKAIELGQALSRLEQDADFIAVVGESYIKDTLLNESKYLVDVSPAGRQEVLEKLMSVNYLRKHLSIIKNNYNSALEDLYEGDVE